MQLSEASCPPFCSARPSDNIERNRRAPRDTSLRRNARNKQGSGSVSFSNSLANIVAGRQAAWHRAKTRSGCEEAYAYRCTCLVSLGRIGRLTRCCATRYVERPVTIGGSRRAVSAHAGPEPRSDDRCFLHRGNDGDILQRRHRTQHEWLWDKERLRIAQRVRIEQRRRREYVVNPALPDRAAIQ
jgi:hypothetical protein